jgi:hypothetical protein
VGVDVAAVLLGVLLLVAVVVYFLAPLLLRWSGVATTGLGVWSLLCAQPLGLVLVVTGVLVWLAGHWAVAARDGVWLSPLAYRCWARFAGGQLNPTRGRVVPIYMRRRVW